jgi:hypothetical protein
VPFNAAFQRSRLLHLDTLIAEGERLAERVRSNATGRTEFSARTVFASRYVVERVPFVDWRVRCTLFLGGLLASDSAALHLVDRFKTLDASADALAEGLGILRALRRSIAEGALSGAELQLRRLLLSEMLNEAERLLTAGQLTLFDHAAPAVLAGAVLDEAVRTLCASLEKPLRTQDDEDRPIPLERLIRSLGRREVLDDAARGRLLAFAGFYRHAVQGAFDAFDQSDATAMVTELRGFIDARLR